MSYKILGGLSGLIVAGTIAYGCSDIREGKRTIEDALATGSIYTESLNDGNVIPVAHDALNDIENRNYTRAVREARRLEPVVSTGTQPHRATHLDGANYGHASNLVDAVDDLTDRHYKVAPLLLGGILSLGLAGLVAKVIKK